MEEPLSSPTGVCFWKLWARILRHSTCSDMKGRAIQPPVYWLFPGKQSWWFCLRKQQYICGGESPGGGLRAGETRLETLEKVAEPSGKGQRRLKVKVRTRGLVYKGNWNGRGRTDPQERQWARDTHLLISVFFLLLQDEFNTENQILPCCNVFRFSQPFGDIFLGTSWSVGKRRGWGSSLTGLRPETQSEVSIVYHEVGTQNSPRTSIPAKRPPESQSVIRWRDRVWHVPQMRRDQPPPCVVGVLTPNTATRVRNPRGLYPCEVNGVISRLRKILVSANEPSKSTKYGKNGKGRREMSEICFVLFHLFLTV